MPRSVRNKSNPIWSINKLYFWARIFVLNYGSGYLVCFRIPWHFIFWQHCIRESIAFGTDRLSIDPWYSFQIGMNRTRKNDGQKY